MDAMIVGGQFEPMATKRSKSPQRMFPGLIDKGTHCKSDNNNSSEVSVTAQDIRDNL